MRVFPIVAVLLLAACANQTTVGLSDADPGVDVAAAALRSGSPEVALRIDEALLAKDPHDVSALINRGDALTSQQSYAQAAEAYAAALKADPASVPAQIGLARLRLTQDPAAAEKMFLSVLQRQPRNAVALNDLGIAQDLLGRHEEAQVAYRKAMGIDSSMTGARVNLALSLAMTGRADDAAPMLRSVAEAPNAPRKYRHDLAAVLAMGGDREAAQQILAKDMSPEQVNRALAVFTEASAPADGATPSAQAATAQATAAPAASAPQAQASQQTEPTPVVPVATASLEPAARPVESPRPLAAPQSAVAAPSVPAPAAASAPPAAAKAQPDDQAAATEPSSDSATHDVVVQFTSETSEALAEAKWQKLQLEMPALTADHQPDVVRVERFGRDYWRVRISGFASPADALKFCRSAKTKGPGCYIIRS